MSTVNIVGEIAKETDINRVLEIAKMGVGVSAIISHKKYPLPLLEGHHFLTEDNFESIRSRKLPYLLGFTENENNTYYIPDGVIGTYKQN